MEVTVYTYDVSLRYIGSKDAMCFKDLKASDIVSLLDLFYNTTDSGRYTEMVIRPAIHDPE